MRPFLKRFFEEFFLYSTQLVVLFVITLFLTPAEDSFETVPLVIMSLFLLVQTLLLVGQGHNPLLRFLFSFISPAAYTLVRILSAGFMPFDMANTFLWIAAFYVGLFQALSIGSRSRWVKRFAETCLVIGTVFVFVFFYLYLDLRVTQTRLLKRGAISLAQYHASLNIRNFPPAFVRFMSSAPHAFLVLGAATFAVMILVNKITALSLRERIVGLFGETRLQGMLPSPQPVEVQQTDALILSSNIWDFSSFVESVSPTHAVDVLNRYYALWETLAERHRGKILNLTGDSVIIAFGLMSGDAIKDSAEQAAACAFDFFKELPGLRSDIAAASMPALGNVGVGIHRGPVIVGELGLQDSRHLSVMGDTVSIAARLDSLCKEFKQSLLLSQPAFRLLGLETQSRFQHMGEVLLRNTTQPVPVYGIR